MTFVRQFCLVPTLLLFFVAQRTTAQTPAAPLFPIQGVKIWLGNVPGAYNEYLGQPLDTSRYYRWRDVLDRIRQIGANHVTLQLTTGVMLNPTDNTFSDAVNYNPPIAAVRGMAADIRARGMSVGVSIFTNIQNVITGATIGGDRPNPSNPVAWFGEYRPRVLEWARLAEELGASSFVFAQDEVQDLMVLPELEPHWIGLIDGIKGVFSGKVTTVLWTPGVGNSISRLRTPILTRLDYLGVGFFPALTAAPDPTVEQLILAYTRNDLGADVLGFLRDLSVTYGKKVWITDKAFHSYRGAAMPTGVIFNETTPLTPDEGLQARLYDSFLQVMSSQGGEWLHGVSFQSFNNLITGRVPTARFISSPVSESPQNKEAETVLADWYGGRRTQPRTSYLSNLSVRVAMRSDQTLIVGFSVTGGAKPLLLRASGPALNTFGLTGVPNPRIGLFQSSGTLLIGNEDWRAPIAGFFPQVGAFAWPAGSRDAALFPTLVGDYTAHAIGAGAGTLLLEAYDAGTNLGPQLSNLSARFQVGTGADVLIAGFALGGNGQRRVLIRAIGPRLVDFGVTGVLARPRLRVFQGNRELATATGWAPELAAAFTQVGAFALMPGSADAALVLTLEAGQSYTAQVSGVDDTTGEALVEVYALP